MIEDFSDDEERGHSAKAPPLDPNVFHNAWLNQFTQDAVIGELYDKAGKRISVGKTPFEWLKEMNIFPKEERSAKTLSMDVLREKFLQLAQRYGTASSYYGMLKLAADALRGQVSAQENAFIQQELAKYDPGGEFFDDITRKPRKRSPSRENLEALAAASMGPIRDQLHWCLIQAQFFQNIMDGLETQRRCLKDYAETHNIEFKSF